MVDNYLQGCGYNIPRLKSHIFIFDDSILRYINVDNGLDDASILNAPSVLTGFSINFSEETSLDERYKFSKELNISVNDKVDVKELFNGRYYVIVEDLEGNYYLTNSDFKYKYTYNYTLSEGVNQTDITLQTDSNFPLLKIDMPKIAVNACKTYKYVHIKQLQMIEVEKAKWSNYDRQLTISESLKTVDFNRNSLSFNESFDGERVTATLSFNMPLKSANESWPYNLLEFQENKYTAVITTDENKQLITGIYTGLQPSYNINGSDNEDGNIYEITLIEVSNNSSEIVEIKIEEKTGYTWTYIQQLDGNRTWHCNASRGFGLAEIWVQAEVDSFGNHTGRYKILEDIYEALYGERDPEIDYSYYDDNYGWIRRYNVIGSFQTQFPTNWFPTNECINKREENRCLIETDIVNGETLVAGGSYAYYLKASCDWEITNINNLTISPTTGTANVNQLIEITAGNEIGDASFTLSCCDASNGYSFNIDDGECIKPSLTSVTCEGGTVIYTVKDGCEISNFQTYLPYKVLDNGNLQVTVPPTDSTSGNTYFITLDCCGVETTLQIMQNRAYTFWGCMEDDCGYVCENGNKYAREYLYTGATSTEWHKTDTYRKGELIETNSRDCRSQTRYEYGGNNVCIDGKEYETLQEQISYDDGQTWIPTGADALGRFIQEGSTLCEEETTYKWVLTNESTCLDD